MRSQVEKLSEELETYKSPGTCALHLALKYPVPQAQTQVTPDHTSSESQPEPMSTRLKKSERHFHLHGF